MDKKQNAELVGVSKIRFGDPVTAIGIGNNSIMHGSIMGRIMYYSLTSKTEKEILDLSDETARDITLSSDGSSYYIANGDIGWHTFPENGVGQLRTFAVEVRGTHADMCERSCAFQAKGYNCVVVLASEEDDTSKSELKCSDQFDRG